MLDNLILETDVYLKMYAQINEQYIRGYLKQLVFSLLRNVSFLAVYLTALSELAANGRMLDWEVFLRSYPCRFKD
jgi:hypothetical protein